eukprot:gene27685-7326_t
MGVALPQESEGWEWTDEGRGKWGWVATQPLARLVLRFDSNIFAPTDPRSANTVAVSIAHLKSYEHMGEANVTCISGCSCQWGMLDGDITDHYSQLRVQEIKVTQAANCTIAITVIKATHAHDEGHKVKIGGVMVSEEHFSEHAYGMCVPGGEQCIGSESNNVYRREMLALVSQAL